MFYQPSLSRPPAVSRGPSRAGRAESGGPYRGGMRVHVVSDVHGRADALAVAGHGADALICLGDLLLFLDYADYGQGIFADLFGAEATQVYVELRTAGRFDEARELSARLLAQRGAGKEQSPASLFETAMARDLSSPANALISSPMAAIRQRHAWWQGIGGDASRAAHLRTCRPPQ